MSFILILGAAFFLFEGTLRLIYPWLFQFQKGPLHSLADGFYSQTRKVIHYDPQCAQTDPDLIYALKPGRCFFENPEFKTEVRINQSGFRDDKASVQAPEIIVLGDSYAMGWGVEQEQSFPQQLEKMLGRRVLNAGVSSYGSVREAKLLNRLDTSRLRYLIIQYCSNDYEENQILSKNPSDKDHHARYQREIKSYLRRQGPFWGKFSYFAMRIIQRKIRSLLFPAVMDMNAETSYFLEAFSEFTKTDLRQIKILVFELDVYSPKPYPFIPALSQKIEEGNYPPFGRENVTVKDLTRELKRNDYFNVDEHLTSEGNAVIARQIAEWIHESERGA